MIQIQKNNLNVSITIDADIINISNTKLNLYELQIALKKQLEKVYNSVIGKYNVSLQLNSRVISAIKQCSPRRVLFQVVDSIPGNNPAEADFKGLRVKLNITNIKDFTSLENYRTLPHELGHLLGIDHPHDNAKFESVNPKAHALEQQLTEEERQHNLMSQTWYIQKANVDLNNSLQLTENQIDVILHYYFSNQLNQNKHLRYFWFWKKLV